MDAILCALKIRSLSKESLSELAKINEPVLEGKCHVNTYDLIL